MSSDDLFGSDEFDDEIFNVVVPKKHHQTFSEHQNEILDQQNEFFGEYNSPEIYNAENFDSYFEDLSKADFCGLINDIINKKNINDGSAVVFQAFRKFIENNIHSKKFNKDDVENLNFLAEITNKLRDAKKFSEINFATSLLNCYLTLPFELIWWLHKQQLIYFEQYWDSRNPEDIPDQLLKVLESNNEDYPFDRDTILQDILEELLSGCYGPRTGICRLYKSKLWSTYCSDTLTEFTEKALAFAVTGSNKPFYNFLPLIRDSLLLPSTIKNRFYSSIIQKLITFKPEEYNIDTAFLYQQLWTTTNISKDFLILFNEIFTKYCDFSDIMNIFDKYNHTNMNWKFLLISIAACIKFSRRSFKQLQDAVVQHLNLMFKGGKITYYKTAILFIRQATLEDTTEQKYESWYSEMFGINSVFKTVENQTMFNFFISCLTRSVVLEPKYFLKIHLHRSLRAPSKCNNAVLDYKNICRARLLELQRYPTITINDLEVNILQLVENTHKLQKPDPILLQIMKEKYDEFYKKIIPYLLREQHPFANVKNLLVSNKFLSNDLLSHCQVAEDVQIIIDDDDDYISGK